MKTTMIMLQTLCVPCNCHCRYCLLSWNGKVNGADYDRSKAYAKKFYEFIKKERPDVGFDFSFGYCMDHPSILDEIDFLQSVESVEGRLLQFDGMRFRNSEEMEALMSGLKMHGIEHLNFTFYGLQDYHDRFAGRKGDFEYMVKLIGAAKALEIETSVGIPITSENCGDAETLVLFLTELGVNKISAFIPHSEGRGITLEAVRLTKNDYEHLGEHVKTLINTNVYRTEAEWINDTINLEDEHRAIIISLTPDNIEQFEKMSFDEAIKYVEELDEKYYETVPSFDSLKEIYGDINGDKLYRKRDLYWKYQKTFLQEHHVDIYDVTDERQCGSRRY